MGNSIVSAVTEGTFETNWKTYEVCLVPGGETKYFNSGPVTEACVSKDDNAIQYKYRFHVWVKEKCTLWIKDEENDEYYLTIYKKGKHYVDYNSNKPNIVRIKARY